MGLEEGKLYMVKRDKDWVIAMFTGFSTGRSRGVDWRWTHWAGADGTFRIPASDTFLTYFEIDETD